MVRAAHVGGEAEAKRPGRCVTECRELSQIRITPVRQLFIREWRERRESDRAGGAAGAIRPDRRVQECRELS